MLCCVGRTVAVSTSPRGTGPLVLVGGGIVLIGVGIWMFVTGLLGTVDTFRDSFETATDVTAGLSAVAAVPGEVSERLEPDRYQVVAIGRGLTSTRINAAGVNEREVYALSFARPEVTVTGPDGTVALGPPTIDQLVDGPAGDLVAIGEFTVPTGATYTLTATGSDTPVTRVGIDVRPDVGALIRESAVDIGKLVFSGFVGFAGVCLLIGGIVWRLARRHASLSSA